MKLKEYSTNNISNHKQRITNNFLNTRTMKLNSISSWLNVKKPLIISGPCSAETEEQTIATAKQIAATGKVHALRAGIWKPRTRPGQYEGAGDIGLKWLINA